MSRFEALSDEELVVQIRRGEREAFVELVNRYKGPIYGLAYRMVGDHGRSEDIAQDTFLRVYENIDRFKVSRKFSSWIFRIATNLCIDLLRKHGRIQVQSTDQPVPGTEDFYPELPSDRPAPDSVAVNRELQSQLQALIETLPPKYRAVIVLRYVQDLPYKEIAEVLDMPLGTVKTRLFRGRESLRRKLEDNSAFRSLVNELLEEEILPEDPAADRAIHTAEATSGPEPAGEGLQ